MKHQKYYWKGKRRYLKKNGYYTVYYPEHPVAKRYKSKWVYEHWLVAWNKYGEQIFDKDKEIHHIDGNSKNNRYDNISLIPKDLHKKLHGKGDEYR